MYTVKADLANNRLYLKLSGFLGTSEAVDIKVDIINEVAKLSPGFDIINDITTFRLGLDESAGVLNEVINFLIDKKVNRIVRVVGSSRSGVMQLAQYTKKSDKYITHFVPTMEEAELLLAGKK